eukprot:COSAG02_NODE_68853_length_217_cov_1.923729_1_plen_55_part_01
MRLTLCSYPVLETQPRTWVLYQGEWAQDKDSGKWLCAMNEGGELYVTAKDAQQTR